jgi:TfoX/Sxy family transcriptional regulator of competence genes
MFSGWGFYCQGLLFAAAWDGAFRFRSRQDGRWVYQPVEASMLDEPDLLVKAAREALATLETDPVKGSGRRGTSGSQTRSRATTRSRRQPNP